jgi:predicted transcriptional regulator
LRGFDDNGKAIYYKANKGKVIGEFVCDEITPLFNVATTSWSLLAGNIHEYAKGLVRMARLTEEEMHSYAKGKNCYAWHISDLVIYDKPRELSEFKKPCNHKNDCCTCDRYDYIGHRCYDKITRPPQSWCYVESEGEG